MRKTVSPSAAGWIYAYVHFAVETTCFWFLFSQFREDPAWWILALSFDALAFVPQCFLGLLADRLPQIRWGTLGCGLIMAALVLPAGVLSLCVLCLGNALTHVDGASHTLRSGDGKLAPCGVFVAGGSFGVVTGQLLGSAGGGLPLLLLLMAVALAATAVIITPGVQTRAGFFGRGAAERPLSLLVLLAAGIVAIRAYIGYAIPTEWNKTTLQTVFLFCSMGVGKAAGGWLCDTVGYRKTAVLSLVAALPFLIFGNSLMLVSLFGVGLFSMTMPVTVGILASCLPETPGFAFGITTVALFLGTVPAFFVRPVTLLAHQLTVLFLSAAAYVFVHFSTRKGC